MEILNFVFNLFQENSRIVINDGRCFVVDPGFSDMAEEETFFSALRERKLEPEAIILTHGHMDHIAGVKSLQSAYGCPVYMAEADKVVFDMDVRMASLLRLNDVDVEFTTTEVSDGDTLTLAGLEFKVIATPGHSPGSICWYCESEKTMFTGDTLFKGTIGRTDLKYGDYDKEIVSIMDKIMAYPADTEIFPGHGPSSTLSLERTGNPMLEPFNEPDQDYNV